MDDNVVRNFITEFDNWIYWLRQYFLNFLYLIEDLTVNSVNFMTGLIIFLLNRFYENPLPWVFIGLWSFIDSLILFKYLISHNENYGVIGFLGMIIGTFLVVLYGTGTLR